MFEYIVNKEKRTVVAMIKFDKGTPSFKDSGDIFDDLWMAFKRLKSSDSFWGNDYREKEQKMYFPKYMSAKAKCNPEDEWDEEYGKKLAYDRLVEKIRKYRSQAYCIVADLVEEIKEFVC
jgi:hypothetical protein